MDTRTKRSGIFIAAIIVVSVFASTMPVGAKVKTQALSPTGPALMTIDNGIINITVGETGSPGWSWFYRANATNFREAPLMSYGTNKPVYLSSITGTVYQSYPSTGDPDVWYDAIVGLDLDSDTINDVNVTRSVMVPSGKKYFYIRYCIENINTSDLGNFRFFQGVDYDVMPSFLDDEGGYAGLGDFVWAHDLGVLGTYVGFTGNRRSAHHSVAYFTDMWWNELETGSLNDSNYFRGVVGNDSDVGVGLEWDLGTLPAGETACITLKFAFADSYDELHRLLTVQAPTFTPIGLIALVAMLSAIAALSIKIRKRR